MHTTTDRSLRLLVLALSVSVASACSDDKDESADETGASATALDANAQTVLERMAALEVERDVTCWTSFRQLDWFIAEKSYSEFATLAKIRAIKGLVRGVWAVASAAESGEAITAKTFDGVVQLPEVAVPDPLQKELETFANDIGLQNFKDYQKTAEHWRVVLAVLQDEIYQSGGESTLKPFDDAALERFADAATTLSLLLLKESGSAATTAKANEIEGEHIQTAYRKLTADLGLANEERTYRPLDPDEVERRLQPITRTLIDGKVEALLTYNKGAAKLTEDLNKVSRLPLTDDAVKLWLMHLQSFVRFVASGFDPMRADNYLSDGSFAKAKLPRRAYLTEVGVQNAVMQLFPHHMLPNGDVLIRFEPNPGPVAATPREPFEIRMLDHEMNGVRDSAIHWIAMRNWHKEQPYAMDPFAAEYLSEVVSMMMTAWIRRGETIANEMGKKEIDLEVATRVRDRGYVMVPPVRKDAVAWGEKEKAAKLAALESYPKKLFRDVTARSGLPTELEDFGSLTDVEGHVEPKKKGGDLAKVEGHVEPKKKGGDLAKVEGHVEPKKKGGDLAKVEGHVEPRKKGGDLAKVEGHVEPRKKGGDLADVEGHVAPDVKSVQGHFNLQRIMGGGIAVGDVNGDGYPDLYLAGEALGRLYINKGKKGPGRFVDATSKWGLPDGMRDGHGTLFFDLEGDRDLDLLILRSDHSSMIFENQGRKFVDISEKLGFETHRGAHVANVLDYDRDGDLDLYIGYYGNHLANTGQTEERSLPSLDGRNGSPNQLWRNDGGAKLVEVAAEAGVADVGWTLALGSFDYDNDGDLDLYLANDFGENRMYQNQGDGTFVDVSDATGTADRGSGMNVDVGDVNGDGRWDIYVTNIDMFSKRIKVVFPRDESTIDIDESLVRAFQYLSGNKLYVSEGESGFVSVEDKMIEPGDRGWGWDAGFVDYENDGDDDMYLTNGWIEGSYAGDQKNQMFLFHDGFFYLAPESSPEAFAGNTRSAAYVDIDLDGDLDLIANQFRQPPRVLENTQRSGNRWIQLSLRGQGKNPYAVGATLRIQAGDKTVMRAVTGGRGYLSQANTVVSAGAGAAKSVDVTIRWPDGSATKHSGLATNKRHAIEQPGS